MNRCVSERQQPSRNGDGQSERDNNNDRNDVLGHIVLARGRGWKIGVEVTS